MELEAQQAPRIPQTFAEALRLAAEMEEQKETPRWRDNMSNIITRDYNGNVFQFRADGYFNMTKAAKAFGKEARFFMALDSTKEYLEALEQTVGKSHSLVETTMGRNGGTWGHPKLAVFFARWLDVKFAVFCDMVIDDILNKKAELTITKPEESMAMKVPQTFSEALRLAA